MISLDAFELMIMSLTTICAVGLGLLVGKWLDIFWRASILRKITKQDFGILGMFSPDTKSVRMIVVNFSKDVVQHKGKIWIVLKDRIYRHDKPERGINMQKSDLPIKWIEGVPVLYVNETTYLPIAMEGLVGEVRPEEVNAVFSSWINNQLGKAMLKILSQFKNQQTFLVICVCLSLAAAGVSYLCLQEINNIKAQTESMSRQITAIAIKTGAAPPEPAPTGK